MKVYVDELPKDCWNCKFLDKNCREYDGSYCAICQREFNDEDIYVSELSFEHKKNEDCPLQSLSDHTKQVRKEVIGELMNMLGDRAELIDCGGVAEFMFTTYDLTMCVEEILGEEVKEK